MWKCLLRMCWIGIVVPGGLLGCGEGKARRPSEAPPDVPPLVENKTGLAPTAVGSEGHSAEKGGAIEGTARFVDRPIPTSTLVPVGTDRAYCGKEHSKEDRVVDPDTGEIRYVIVWISSERLRSWQSVKPGHLLFDNRNCRFEPHAAVLTVGSTLEMHNDDSVPHTVHAYFAGSFNIGLTASGGSDKRILNVPGLIKLTCDIHGWMNAYIRVDRHPFHSVTDSRGRFQIQGIPPGTYMLHAWHESFGRQKREVTVRNEDTTTVMLTYSKRGNVSRDLSEAQRKAP